MRTSQFDLKKKQVIYGVTSTEKAVDNIGTGVQEDRNKGVQENRNLERHEHRNTGSQEYRNSGLWKDRNEGT